MVTGAVKGPQSQDGVNSTSEKRKQQTMPDPKIGVGPHDRIVVDVGDGEQPPADEDAQGNADAEDAVDKCPLARRANPNGRIPSREGSLKAPRQFGLNGFVHLSYGLRPNK
jgi:hypothetical protein